MVVFESPVVPDDAVADPVMVVLSLPLRSFSDWDNGRRRRLGYWVSYDGALVVVPMWLVRHRRY